MKGNGNFVRNFAYTLVAVIVISVVYIEVIAKPMPYIGVKGEEKIETANESIIQAIKQEKVTAEQTKKYRVQQLTFKPEKELYLLNTTGNENVEYFIKKSKTAQQAEVEVYALPIYYQGRHYEPSNTPTIQFEDEDLTFDEGDYKMKPVYIISSGAFYLPFSPYAKAVENSSNAEWKRNNGMLIVKLTIPEHIKLHKDDILELD